MLTNQIILNTREIKLNEFQVHVNNQGITHTGKYIIERTLQSNGRIF